MKIYIIGPVGSGKTTFSEFLSNKYNIKKHELDKVVWDDDNGNVKRSIEEINKLFEKIINQKSWIIEDVGRNKFKKGRDEADIIYYLKISRFKSYYRVLKRWLKQRLGKERYNYPPTIGQIFYYISTVNSYFKKEPMILEALKKYKDKVIYLKSKEVNNILNIRE